MESKSFLWYPGMVVLLALGLIGIAPARADQCQASLNLTRPCTPAEQAEYERVLKAKQGQTRRKAEARKAAGGFGRDLTPEEQAQWEMGPNNADVNLSSNGQTFTFNVTSMVSIYLDDEKYPVSALTLTCEPKQVKGEPVGAMGYPTLGNNGPGRYPVEFRALEPGTCVLKDKDFAVTIIVPEFEHHKHAEDQDRDDQHNEDDHPKTGDHEE